MTLWVSPRIMFAEAMLFLTLSIAYKKKVRKLVRRSAEEAFD